MYYLAYGLSLNKEVMTNTIKDAKLLGKVIVVNYSLVCNRYLSLKEKNGSQVEALLYEIPANAVKALDDLENFPYLTAKQELKINYNGQEVMATCYVLKDLANNLAPFVDYEQKCLAAYEEANFNSGYLKQVFSQAKTILDYQKAYYRTGETKSYAFRINMLKKLKAALLANEASISQALKEDLNKSDFETYITETSMVLTEINYFLKHLKKLMQPKKVKTPITVFPGKGYIYPEPYGSALIIGPWNYPLQLALAPLVGAIAGGNTAVLKTSELAPATSKAISDIIGKTYPAEYIAVVNGGVEESTKLLALPFDKIFFTGSVRVGKIVMAAASKNLTPVTLELGGKSPVIITKKANLDLTARRLIWGKVLNAGQTCIAPDYVFVDEEIKDELLFKIKAYLKEILGVNPLENPNYPRIISASHFKRLIDLIDEDSLVYGGNYDTSSYKIEPTILLNPNPNKKVLEEEIFGPILAILTYKKITDVYDYILNRPKPLALYIFSDDKVEQKTIIDTLSFGGGCINDTILHLTCDNLPFGGVGDSGMGNYHGAYSFKAFTHEKGILHKKNYLDIKLRYYPFTKAKVAKIKKLIK